ncbi:CAMK family protein kinase [Tritrichomonas foetus]|uniref:CAMK family protein kinase n=1 Tax=Tritrichomonas foetus TaxID=1144522 RepID=A0A1J4K0C1_9EUKA|nr:CAMK family protein kinase [Tritrichomonas foetus]|eukprot:OHT03220.1 CAMK family protein kinase [Tritrichomonas foetus]
MSDEPFNIQEFLIDTTISKSSTSLIKHASKKDKSQYAVKIISQKNPRQRFNNAILHPLIIHPNVAETIDIVETGGFIYQFMPYYEYGDLLHFLRKKELPPHLQIKVCEQLLSAVESLHALGICHRDIKPENILLGKHAVIRLSDFGSASLAFDGNVTGRVGSFEYSSPEAIRSMQPYDGFKSDMWSVGVVFYVIFARRQPFSNINMDFDYQSAINNLDCSMMPKPIEEIVKSLLSIDPNSRPTATECLSSDIFSKNPTQQVDSQNSILAPQNLNRQQNNYNGNFNGTVAARKTKRIRPPLSSIKLHADNKIDANQVISKLSQALEMPINDFKNKIRESDANTEKLLLLLYNRRSFDMANHNFYENSGERIERRRFAQLPEHSNVQLVRKVGHYQTSASSVYSTMHAFLLQKKNFLISTPLSDSPAIILKNGPQEARIGFQVVDGDDGRAMIMLWTNIETVSIMSNILKALDQCFPVQS